MCKGKASGFNVFVCSECGVFYCLNCAKVLNNLENLSWVCNSQLNESKYFKLPERMDEAIKEVIEKRF